ncbi:MAG: hypothetical protein JNN32_02495 [Flavobacteriales bacterium]|nr:hypothetical protein [Flavobacteriales bacterium]
MHRFHRFFAWSQSGRLTVVLIAVHVLMLLAVLLMPHAPSADEPTYVALAESMDLGTFSVWADRYDPAPVDTHRTHGYPAFVWLLRKFSTRVTFIFIAQALMHFATLLLVLRYLSTQTKGTFKSNVFLMAMLPQLQLLHYVGQVFPEVLMSLLCTAIALSYTVRGTGLKEIALRVVLLALAFWVRPVMLLFPLFVLVADLLVARGAERWSSLRAHSFTLVAMAMLGPVPFAYWNHVHHGVWKPVPLSGSAVISNMGIWQLRLPGYGTMHYFQHSMFGREFIPWVGDSAAAVFYGRYQDQWRRIDAKADPYRSVEDVEQVPLMMADPQRFAARSPGYTIALDRAIAEENRAMIKAEPFYYLATRLYTAVRLWVTNINLPMERIIYKPTPGSSPQVGRPQGLVAWAKLLVPFAITFISFGTGLTFLFISVMRHRKLWVARRYLLYMILYVWLVHIPMVIQSRYTVPVHVLAILCIALALSDRYKPAEEAAALTTH